MRLLHHELVVVDDDVAEVGGNEHVGAGEADFVHLLRRRDDGVLQFGHVDDFPVVGNHVDVGVGVHHHQIVFGVVVEDVRDVDVRQVVLPRQRLVLLCALVEAEQASADEVVHLVAGVDAVLCL